jgi:hypothetical protein
MAEPLFENLTSQKSRFIDCFGFIHRNFTHYCPWRNGIPQVCARRVPRCLREKHYNLLLEFTLLYLHSFKEEGSVFLESLATGDETWMTCYTLQTKKHSNYLTAKKLGSALVCWKICGISILSFIEFMRVGFVLRAQQSTGTPTATNARGCSQEMRSLCTTGQPEHSTPRTLELLQLCLWKRLSHQPPSDYHLFGSLKQHLGHCRFHNNEFGSGGRVVWGVGLRPLACWNCGFESREGHGYLSCEWCVLSEVSATGRSLIQRSPTECGCNLAWSGATLTIYT